MQEQNTINSSNERKIFAYQDFNISFGGRTPENFYEQDFNRNNMPDSMKEYLFYDYETRQHIPPQQMMAEVFKYIGAKDVNLETVKKIYPDESLFKNLHENRKNNTKNLLAEIKIARELGSTPLLKNGSDDFGMYLLRKIYLEGKTIKEIHKDFYENDLNDEYKGVLTKPIDTDVTSAYGIRFPKHAFWHSFIATREEYKKFFVTLPKNSANPAAHISGVKSAKAAEDEFETAKEVKLQPRKFKMQNYRKNQLANDIKNSKGTSEDIVKHVKRRFGKDDPESSFIVKYFSPIMTVASDRVNLSEELKIFNEMEKLNGKQGDETFMFTRFWKNNPQLRSDFASAITNTIDLLEEIYAAGGSIPINSDLEMVSPDTKNQKVIDYVSLDFLDFLDKIKNLEIERLQRYSEHDKLQAEWEQHFEQMYPVVAESAEDVTNEEKPVENAQEIDHEELLRKIAQEQGGEVIKLKGKEEDILAVTKLDEAFRDYLKNSAVVFPSGYAKLFVNDLLNANLSREFKLSSVFQEYIDKVDESDPQILDDNQYSKILFENITNFYNKHLDESKTADAALADSLIISGFNDKRVYALDSLDYLVGCVEDSEKIKRAIVKNKTKIDSLYNLYKRPLTQNEISKISLSLIDSIDKYDPKNSIAKHDVKNIILMLRDMIKADKNCRRLFRELLQKSLELYPYTKAVLNKDIPKEFKQARFEQSITPIILDLLETDIFLQIINKETVQRYTYGLSPYARDRFEFMERGLNPMQRNFYETPTDMISSKYNDGYQLIQE